MKNVQIAYIYRDASNYKYHSQEVMTAALDDGEIAKVISILQINGQIKENVAV